MSQALTRILAGALAGGLLAAAAPGQTTVYFSENFNGAFPPSGWSLVNENGHTGLGWQQSTDLRAWHEDEPSIQTDDSLETGNGLVDLQSAVGGVYLHFHNDLQYASYLANHPSSNGNGVSDVNVSTDGGATWTNVWTETRQTDGLEDTVIDLTSYAGQTIDLQFYYSGLFAHEVWYDNVEVNDDPAQRGPPPTTWDFINLPTSFTALPVQEDFEAAAGVVQPYMAVTAVNAASLSPDPDAWCNIGQMGPMTDTVNSGLWALEMGLSPTGANNHYVRNALVLGIDGSGWLEATMDLWAIDHSDELHDFDGAWVSEDGVDWYRVAELANLPSSSTWTQVVGMDLEETGVNVDGHFYVMFSQEDNFAYAGSDGIGVDDVTITPGNPASPSLDVVNLVAGDVATISTSRMTAGSEVVFVFSTTGGGPVNTPFGPLQCSPPLIMTPPFPVDGEGEFSFDAAIPTSMAGETLWGQAVELYAGGGGQLSDAIQQPVL